MRFRSIAVATTFFALMPPVVADDNPFANLNDPVKPPIAADLSTLSDEFNDPQTLANWRQASQEEKWTENQIERLDIGQTQANCLALVPYTSGWYQDFRGVLLFKPVEGDFVVTTHLRVTGRDGRNAPARTFSLAGIMARAPRQITQETWQPGGENYVFTTMGAAFEASRYSFEMKNTVQSRSDVRVAPAGGAEGFLQLARIGAHFLLLGRPADGQWRVLQRFHRPDLPAQLQVGLTGYTDWPTVEHLQPRDANTRRLDEGRPDLLALFDYMRFARPKTPENLRDAVLSDPRAVADAQLLAFLGEAANVAPAPK